MINRRTVLILGAGASAPYGFPTGLQLKKEILQRDPEQIIKAAFEREGTPSYSPLWRYVIDKYGKRTFVKFFRSLKMSGKYSVDAFLEHRREFVDIGKALMAIELIKYENKDALYPENGNWYQFIYNKLNASYEEFHKNNIAVITFNYDRSFEYCLQTYIQNDYDKTASEAAEALSSVPIIHLHGLLGDLSENDGVGARVYSGITTPDTIDTCVDKIKIIFEEISEDDDEFNKARDLISEAEIVWFLGFGYDERNLIRLKIPQSLKRPQQVLGTTYNLAVGEIIGIRSLFNPYFREETVDMSGRLDVLSYLRTFSNYLI